jgi:hypothetical protein
MSELESDSHMFGDGMPRGNKNAGYIGLMMAKRSGKKPSDYDNGRKKKSGKFNINKMKDPSAYLRNAFVHQLKTKAKKPTAVAPVPVAVDNSWAGISARFPDKKRAVFEYKKANPSLSQRAISRDTGVPQPTVNRYLKLTFAGSGKFDEPEEATSELLDRFVKPNTKHITKAQMGFLKRGSEEASASARSLAERTRASSGVSLSDREKLDKLITLLGEWERARDTLGELVESGNARRLELGDYNTGTLGDEPTGRTRPENERERNRPKLLKYKMDYFKATHIITQIRRAIGRIALHIHPRDEDEPRNEDSDVRLRERASPADVGDYEKGENYIQHVDEDEPIEGGGLHLQTLKFLRQVAKNQAGLKGYSTMNKAQLLKALADNGISGGNHIVDYAQQYERQPVRGGNAIVDYAQQYERQPVRGGGFLSSLGIPIISDLAGAIGLGKGKAIKHLYTQDGRLYKGKYHIMENGDVHTGVKHTARSKPLIVK